MNGSQSQEMAQTRASGYLHFSTFSQGDQGLPSEIGLIIEKLQDCGWQVIDISITHDGEFHCINHHEGSSHFTIDCRKAMACYTIQSVRASKPGNTQKLSLTMFSATLCRSGPN